MKTIIATTDFSDSGNSAARYAAGLAVKTGARLILFHAYNIPIPSTEIPVFTISPREIRRDCIDRLRLVKEKIEKKAPGVMVELMASPGFPAQEIISHALKTRATMIVLGIRKRKRKLGELLGSVATDVMRKAGCEVLIVPENVIYRDPSSLLFAYDYNAPLPEEISNKLKSYIKLFNADLMVVDVVDPVAIPGKENALAGVKLENTLAGIGQDAYFPSSEDPGKELVSFMRTHPTGWLVMLTHSYSLFEKLFHHSLTKEMAFHTDVPLLSIHQ